MQIYWNRDWQLNQLLNWRFQQTATDLWASEGRFYYNSTDDRLVIWRTVWSGRVAYLDDLLGLNKWKYDVKLATRVWENITLSWPQTIDLIPTTDWDKVLVKNQTIMSQNGIYIVNHSWAWTRSNDANSAVELEWCMVLIDWWTAVWSGGNKWTLRRNLDWDWTIVERTSDIHFWQIIIDVPKEDRFVKISSTDIAEKYLSDCFNNAFVTTWPALNNQNIIKLIHLDVWMNESLALWVDLSNYTWSLWITWDFSVTWLTTLNDVLINWDTTYGIGSTINYTNSTTTWTQNFDESYVANYNGSTINYNTSETLLACSWPQTIMTWPVYSTPQEVWVTHIKLKVEYDVAWPNYWIMNDVAFDNTNSPLTVTHPTLPWSITFTRAAPITVVKNSLTADFVIDICQYSWSGATTINNNWWEVNNTNVTTNNTWWTTNNTNMTEVNNGWEITNNNVTINNVALDELISCEVWNFIDSTPVTLTIPPLTDIIKFKLSSTITYWADDQTNPSCLPPYELWHTDVVDIDYELTIWQSATATQSFIPWCWFSSSDMWWVVSVARDGLTNTIVLFWQNNDLWMPMASVNVCSYIKWDMVINNIWVTENYDWDSILNIEWDTNITNLSVTNISYAESYVAGEPLTNRQPLRMWVLSLWENVNQVYWANATDTDHSKFIWFASKNTLVWETLAVLQWPRVIGLKAVYWALVDTSEYFLTNAGWIWLVAWTVSVRLWDADWDDALVWLNAPLPLASLVPPKQLKADNVWVAWQVAILVDQDTFHRWTPATGGGAIWHIEHFVATAWQTVFTLLEATPASNQLVWVSQWSWLYWKQSALYDYTVAWNVITLNSPAVLWDVISIQYLENVPAIVEVRTVIDTATTHTASDQEYIVVTNATAGVTITLPAPSPTAKVRIKKFTGEDVRVISIIPNWAELIEWANTATINISWFMTTLTCVWWNRYMWD